MVLIDSGKHIQTLVLMKTKTKKRKNVKWPKGKKEKKERHDAKAVRSLAALINLLTKHQVSHVVCSATLVVILICLLRN